MDRRSVEELTLRESLRAPREKSTVDGHFRFESMQYVTTVDQAPDLNQSQFLSGRLSFETHSSWSSLRYHGDLAAGTYFKAHQDQFAVNELYAAWRLGSTGELSLGRKRAIWSQMDEAWNMGLWQPRLAIDTLRPESQGLTGLFYESRGDRVQWMGFVTPMFVPTMGPEIREEDGSLVPDNRWYRRPSSTQVFNQKLNQVTYDLDVPDLEKLVRKPGGGMMLRVGDLERGLWAMTAAGLKPVNDLLLRRQIVRYTDQPLFDVKVSPDVAYHRLYSADVGYAWEKLRVSASYMEDHPEEKLPDQDWSIQSLQSVKSASVQGEWDVQSWLRRPAKIQFGHLVVTGAGITDIDSEGETEDFTLFDDRMRFTRTTYIGFEGEVARPWARPLETKVRYLYDQDQKGSLLRTELLYYPRSTLAFVMGADVLGVEDESYRQDGFLNQYRANDRYYGGMAYGF